jgi:hypothetical protein
MILITSQNATPAALRQSSQREAARERFSSEHYISSRLPAASTIMVTLKLFQCHTLAELPDTPSDGKKVSLKSTLFAVRWILEHVKSRKIYAGLPERTLSSTAPKSCFRLGNYPRRLHNPYNCQYHIRTNQTGHLDTQFSSSYGSLTSNFPVACGFDRTHCIPSSIQSSQSFDAFFKPSPNLL